MNAILFILICFFFAAKEILIGYNYVKWTSFKNLCTIFKENCKIRVIFDELSIIKYLGYKELL
jgi:hypothetical protein